MKKIIKAGATDQTIDVFIQDSSSSTGAGLTGLAYDTASLVCYYRKGATGSATQLSLATQTVGGAHSDGGFVEISSGNMPGMYRLDLSDTIIASTGTVTLMLKGAASMAPLPIELQVVAYDPNDAVRLGLTALPNAAADAAGGLPISDAGGLDLDAILSALVVSDFGGGATLSGNLTDLYNRAGDILDDTATIADLPDGPAIASHVWGYELLNAISANVTLCGVADMANSILEDTDELQTNQGNWATATGFSTHSAADVVTAMQVVADDFKADVSGIPTAEQIVDEFESQSQADPTGFHVNVKEINGAPVIGDGSSGDKWRA